MKLSYHRFKNKVKDALVKLESQRDLPHTQQYQTILDLLEQLSDQEKDSLQIEIRKQLSQSGETIDYAQLVFENYFKDYIDYAGKLQPIRVMEIGPGTNLAVGLYFLLAGAAQYVAIDALAAFPERPKEFYQYAIEYIKNHSDLVKRSVISDSDIEPIVKVDKTCEWNPERLQYLTPVFAEKIPFADNFFDYIFSNASFEHFENAGRVIQEVYRALRPKGLTVHTIDLRDHEDFEKPLQFLKFSPGNYKFTSPYGTNRWRMGDFQKAFEDAGFEMIKTDVTERYQMSDSEFGALDAYFRETYSRSELEVVGIKVFATKK